MTQKLFSPLTLRGVTFRNRIFLSPMCLYSAEGGMPTLWHLTHYGCRAIGGAACLLQEATAVMPEGRISPGDLGMWSEAHVAAARPMVQFIKDNGAVPGIQLSHAGRKASTSLPWEGRGYIGPQKGGWEVVGPSPVSFDQESPIPKELSLGEIQAIVNAFAAAAQRCADAGYDVLELHVAHGYLMHQFLSSLSNHRTDEYGGSLENRMRFVLDVTRAVRAVWPERLPLFARLSATDWVDEGGWDVAQSVSLCSEMKGLGVDFIDVSTGGLIPGTRIITGPGYQVPFADAIRQGVQIPVGAVGQITSAEQAEQILATAQADAVVIGRALMRDPYWPLHAAQALGVDIDWPHPYARAKMK
ncbi:MAG: NADH:flavin oxidoreductase/NADH oxidase [Alphaproteobacteria bacterium]|nr:NADH:flavin oxidoreductase/NADH oxidase [Alphaproteobacteria bacterium]